MIIACEQQGHTCTWLRQTEIKVQIHKGTNTVIIMCMKKVTVGNFCWCKFSYYFNIHIRTTAQHSDVEHIDSIVQGNFRKF